MTCSTPKKDPLKVTMNEEFRRFSALETSTPMSKSSPISVARYIEGFMDKNVPADSPYAM
jgi:hypothetical protein